MHQGILVRLRPESTGQRLLNRTTTHRLLRLHDRHRGLLLLSSTRRTIVSRTTAVASSQTPCPPAPHVNAARGVLDLGDPTHTSELPSIIQDDVFPADHTTVPDTPAATATSSARDATNDASTVPASTPSVPNTAGRRRAIADDYHRHHSHYRDDRDRRDNSRHRDNRDDRHHVRQRNRRQLAA